MIGLPAGISRLAHTATTILILWPAAIGYRRFYQGILVRHHLTRRVAYGTVVRLVTMSVTAAILAFTVRPPGAVIGAIALLAGVVAEAVASRWMARHIVRSLMTSDEKAPGTLLGVWEIARFYFPLALTSMLSMALGPLVTFGLGRGRAPLESLAVWPVVNAMAFVFRSGGVAFQEVAIALGGSGGEHSAEVRRAAAWLGAFASLALGVVAFTPLATVWFQDFSGLPPRLAEFALWPIRVLTIYPALEFLLSVQRARWITGHRTGTIKVATALEAFALAASLLLLVGPLDMVGVTAGAIAMLLGRMAANAYLFLRASEQRVEISGV